jgi:glutamate/tyrosine decarboxylase-like PLP-dependent enzyme
MGLSSFSYYLRIKVEQMSMDWKEETLDPDNWDEMKALGHRILDDMMKYSERSLDNQLTFLTDEVKSRIKQPLPIKPESVEKVYEEFKTDILPYLPPCTSPRWLGYVIGPGSPLGMLAELIIAATNSAGGPEVCSDFQVELQVIDWIKEMMDYPHDASGVLVSGATMASFTGLAVARNSKATVDVKKVGLQGDHPRMTSYVSEEGHKCMTRAIELLGLGNDSLRLIPTNDDFQIDISALKTAIEKDREENHHPFCIIGNAGTVNTGAFDDFNALAEICEKEDMWFHIDGAFGAWAKLSSTHRRLVSGIEKADSLALDLHKWMYMPYEIGCALVRDRDAHSRTFVYEAEYFEAIANIADTSYDFANLSLQLSRNFKALKPWMLLKVDGVEKYSRLIQQNIDQAYYFGKLVEEASELELVSPVSLNIVCFRYVVDGFDEESLKKLNQGILGRLLGQTLVISDTTIKGKYTLRACITNHRTKREDISYIVQETIRQGDEITKSR